jgi:hypothetical protein
MPHGLHCSTSPRFQWPGPDQSIVDVARGTKMEMEHVENTQCSLRI